ncbi:MAG TPA: TOBE domain-containing protein, partial [Chthoniobacterales bacterium]
FVASFVGKANFIPGILRSVEGSRCQVETSDGIIEGFVITSELKPGSKVRVMIRPENLRLSPGSADSRHALIKQVSYLGHGTEYLLAAGDRLFRALELRRRGSIPLAEGTPVSYGWNWDEALVYAEEAAI